MLESFISTQKLSVQKALARKFRRFLVAKADFNQLTLYKLQVGHWGANSGVLIRGVVAVGEGGGQGRLQPAHALLAAGGAVNPKLCDWQGVLLWVGRVG